MVHSKDVIQTGAPISPGNSGGAVANGDGQVIGISEAAIPHRPAPSPPDSRSPSHRRGRRRAAAPHWPGCHPCRHGS
ncbi:MAG: hypothetical protein AVDCRST_MAG61-2199 [uncultured Friedmanniella sp.]|uniref:HtrA protease/chaperone protein n=1 Tax=uncultured Friedmanniella sp. TaxID=335381 RepID=A0A6J4KZL0_9ACTN|nr:MAG: hypothetical protein AVDCRST_MAG61-2199 [uncultured Friedmanniella sp.]